MLNFDEVTRCRDVGELNDFINQYVKERELEGESKRKHTWALFYTWRQNFLKREIKDFHFFMQKIKECPQCNEDPIVFIRKEHQKIGLCKEHWEKLAESEISFSTEDTTRIKT
ncbi:MAG: hypothetical protein ACOC6G_01325 [Thermoproteota archaeon]